MRRLITISLFAAVAATMACNQAEQPPAANSQPTNVNANTMVAEDMPFDENDPLIKDNFDLQRAGELLRKSNSPAEFEAYLNEEDGINNLDLNGDGYTNIEDFLNGLDPRAPKVDWSDLANNVDPQGK